MFVCAWGGNQFTPLLLFYREVSGYTQLTVDALLGAYVAGLAPALLVAGALSDRHGRRRIMTVGVLLSLLGGIVLAFGGLGVAPLYAGRVLTGAAVGVAMSVGSSWVKELSQAPYAPLADAGRGARVAALAMTLGFASGAGVAGMLATWGPAPTAVPYLVHVALAAPALVWAARAPETRTHDTGGSLLSRLRVPAVAHRRFLTVVLPMAPWVFSAAAVAYALMPQLIAQETGRGGVLFPTLITVVSLSLGALIQPVARRLDDVSTARGVLASMVLMTAGLALASATARQPSRPLGLLVAVVLGLAYGIGIVSGLLEVQRLAAPDELAGLTGVYYALTYLGFLLPAVLSALDHLATFPQMLLVVTLLCAACTAVVAASSREHLPTDTTDTTDTART
ncbi:MAG: transporter permease [Frankiales bacterium]|nr:transporter permease [Frankiales bacterium]